MPTLHFKTMIQRSPETVYNLIIDFAGYKVWLPSSNLYSQTTLSSSYPVRVGTKYVDQGKMSVMNGEIVGLRPSRSVVFHQMTSGPRPVPGALEVHIRYALEPVEQGTHVTRTLSFHTHGLLTLSLPILLRALYQENRRILQAMKTYLEARV